MQKIAEHIS